MKRKIFTLIALSCWLCACSDKDRKYDDLDPVPTDAVSIRLSQQTIDKNTRSVVKDGDNLTATVVMCDGATENWTGFSPRTTNTISDGKILLARANTSSATFVAGSSSATEVSLTPPLYYNNQTNTEKSWLKAVSPKGTFSGSAVTFAAQDGEQDVMIASVVDAGTHTTPENTITLNFEHQTSQLSFAIKLKPYNPSNSGAWENKTVRLKSIHLQNAALPKSFDVAQNTMTWSNPAALAIPGIENPTISTTEAAIGRPIMTKPTAELFVNATLSVDGVDVNFNNIPIMSADDPSLKLETKIGESHKVTITVIEPGIAAGATPITSVEATIQTWKTGTQGSVTLE